jgi:hypothetical protein
MHRSSPFSERSKQPWMHPPRLHSFLVAAALALLMSLSSVGSAHAAENVPVPSSGAYLGLLSELPGITHTESVQQRESDYSRTFAIDSRYFSWGDSFPAVSQAWDVEGGRVPMITWWWPQHYSDINDGSQDAYIRARALAVKAFGSPIFLRPAAEMNGDWFAWGGIRNNKDTAGFIAAWQRIHDIFESEGVDNVSWVWAPSSESSPGIWDPSSWNNWRNYYPGDAYVDWVGIDGYNFGNLPHGSGWQSLGTIMGPVYNDYAASKPIMIAETGSTESGGDKAHWIAGLGEWVKSHPAVKAVVYFDKTYPDTGHDWATDTSPASMESFRALAADPYFGVSESSPDWMPPDTTITAEPSQEVRSRTASFSFVSTKAESSFECSFDSAPWSGCSSPETYADLATGTHTFAVRAVDAAGNRDSSPATSSYVVAPRMVGVSVFARKLQRQRHRVKIRVKVRTTESVSAKASGALKVGRSTLRLTRQQKRISPGRYALLTLTVRKDLDDRTVMGALRHRVPATATVKLSFADEFNNETDRRVTVRLK